MGCGDIVELLGQRVRLVDLSRPVGPTPSEPNLPRLRYISHEEGAELWEHLFGIPPSALPSGLGFAGETVELSTHAGTHLDAPWHYAPVSGGKPAVKIDEMPLERCVGSAVVLDVSDLPTGQLVTPADIESRLKGLGRALSPGEIVLFRTGADAVWGTEEYFSYGCGLGREAVLYLVERGVRVMGTDAWSLDRPYPIIGAEWREKEDRSLLWPAHYAGIDREYWKLLWFVKPFPATSADARMVGMTGSHQKPPEGTRICSTRTCCSSSPPHWPSSWCRGRT